MNQIEKKLKVDLWMPLYITDYLGDTMHLSTEQHGAYILLLMTAWKRDGSLPDDDVQLRQITRLSEKSWSLAGPILRCFFVAKNGELRNSRVDTEIATFKQLKKQRSDAGKSSADKRKKQRNFNERCNENSTDYETKSLRKSNPSPSPNLPTVVIENLPSQESEIIGQVDAETGEVLWAE